MQTIIEGPRHIRVLNRYDVPHLQVPTETWFVAPVHGGQRWEVGYRDADGQAHNVPSDNTDHLYESREAAIEGAREAVRQEDPSDRPATFYECGICGLYHPWRFNGDCRDDDNRLGHDELPESARIRTMGERLLADGFYETRAEMEADDPNRP